MSRTPQPTWQRSRTDGLGHSGRRDAGGAEAHPLVQCNLNVIKQFSNVGLIPFYKYEVIAYQQNTSSERMFEIGSTSHNIFNGSKTLWTLSVTPINSGGLFSKPGGFF